MTSQAGKTENFTHHIGTFMVTVFHLLALFLIGATIVWSATSVYMEIMAKQPHASIEDILLLFIYLELGAMVGIYFATKKMPVRFLIYIAITALTRLMISVVSEHHNPDLGVVYIAGAILILAVSVLVIRYGQHTYPSVVVEADVADLDDSVGLK